MNKILLLLLFPIFISSCNIVDVNGFIISGSSDHVEERYRSSIESGWPSTSVIRATKNNYKVYLCTDIHFTHNKVSGLEDFVNTCAYDKTAEYFAICLGDMIGGKGMFESFREKLTPFDKAGIQFYPALGNHDLYFDGWKEYVNHWPSSVYTLKVKTPSDGTDLFIFLDSAEGTLGKSQREWLEGILSEAETSSYRHTIILTHTHFFRRDYSQKTTSNYTLDETAQLMSLFSQYGVEAVLTGHDHHYEKTIYKGVCYYTLNSLVRDKGNSSFYAFTFGEDIKFQEYALNHAGEYAIIECRI